MSEMVEFEIKPGPEEQIEGNGTSLYASIVRREPRQPITSLFSTLFIISLALRWISFQTTVFNSAIRVLHSDSKKLKKQKAPLLKAFSARNRFECFMTNKRLSLKPWSDHMTRLNKTVESGSVGWCDRSHNSTPHNSFVELSRVTWSGQA